MKWPKVLGFCLFWFWNRALCILSCKAWTHVAKDDFKFLIVLPSLSVHWDWRCASSPYCVCAGDRAQVFCAREANIVWAEPWPIQITRLDFVAVLSVFVCTSILLLSCVPWLFPQIIVMEKKRRGTKRLGCISAVNVVFGFHLEPDYIELSVKKERDLGKIATLKDS